MLGLVSWPAWYSIQGSKVKVPPVGEDPTVSPGRVLIAEAVWKGKIASNAAVEISKGSGRLCHRTRPANRRRCPRGLPSRR